MKPHRFRRLVLAATFATPPGAALFLLPQGVAPEALAPEVLA